jgi:two-component system cell cycle response regulator DivK
MILIVEDNPPNAELLKLFLERKAGLTCTISTNAEEVLQLCNGGSIRLVIMDIQLNNTLLNGRAATGIELTKQIKENSKTSHIPVLLATAHAMKEQREHFLKESGANGYLIKPIEDYEILIAEIRKWIG